MLLSSPLDAVRGGGGPPAGQDDCAAGVLEASDAVPVRHEAGLPGPGAEGAAVATHDAEEVPPHGVRHGRPEAADLVAEFARLNNR